MDPLSIAIIGALTWAAGGVADGVAGGALQAAGEELWGAIRSKLRKRPDRYAGFDQAVASARKRAVAQDTTGSAAAIFALLAQPAPESRAFLVVALEELLFRGDPNRSRLRESYRHQIPFLAVLAGRTAPPWESVEPLLGPFLIELRNAAISLDEIGPLLTQRTHLATLDETQATRRAVEHTNEILGRIVELFEHRLSSIATIPSITMTADSHASITDSPITVFVGTGQAMAAEQPADLGNLLHSYRAYLLGRYTTLDVRRITASGEVVSIDLERVYVPLHVRVAPRAPLAALSNQDHQPPGDVDLELRERIFGPAATPPSAPLLRPLHDLLVESPALLLLGEPGGGKSTFVRRLVLALANDHAETVFGLNALWLPIVIPVLAWSRARAQTQTLNPLDFLAKFYVERQQPDYGPLFRRALLAGTAYVIFDGLDELPDRATRSELRTLIEEFVHVWDLTGNRFIVTVRSSAYCQHDQDLLVDEHVFTRCALEPLDHTQAEAIIDKITAAVADPALQQRADALKLLLRNPSADPAAATFAENPLLLTLALFIPRADDSVPIRRVEIYDRCVDMLAKNWDSDRSLSGIDTAVPSAVTGMGRFANTFGRAALRKLVHDTTDGEEETDLREHLSQVLCEEGGVRPLDAEESTEEFLKLAEQSTGLFCISDGELTFVHHSFFEYFAGRALATLAVLDANTARSYIRNYGSEERWREVLRFAIASAKYPAVAERLLRQIRALPADGAEYGRPLVLAGEALMDRGPGQVKDDTEVDIVASLCALTGDPQAHRALRVDAGYVLGRLGDPRLLDPDRGQSRGTPRISDVPPYWVAIAGQAAMIGRYPITNAEFRLFLEANGPQGYDRERAWWTAGGRAYLNSVSRRCPAFWHDWRYNQPAQPVVGITWFEAVAYCRWLTAIGHRQRWLPRTQQIRLPIWPEWERAASGPDTRVYPWGDEPPNPERANYQETWIPTYERSRDRATPVGCFPAGVSAGGALDLAGNVAEWTATPAQSATTDVPLDDLAWDAALDDVIISGSSFASPARSLACRTRAHALPDIYEVDRGFRIVQAPITDTPPQESREADVNDDN
ncbi:SUMF1/EgtB/PvdO family nonheme iron enzyme [Oscillochloris sp. ZM17-4]|uniref:SUMF1/EgtB/PvdO family nonheme iron enzyme n=1 Tax=Oscillochloris sp. ZM17-4 TaxID=2866714 RepID=UPI001C72D8AF|nr:SUMF1/EgtB/PvdO family nonheme iron enzyme [Oscillochloris sp. ZM17-4]MBX0331514.1 SUMF1/EgtB/PvdO family nonheme iron enzyme [Oscillochloris sp. ZM17-4]